MYKTQQILSNGKLLTVKLVRTLSGEIRFQGNDGKVIVVDEDTFKKKYREVGGVR